MSNPKAQLLILSEEIWGRKLQRGLEAAGFHVALRPAAPDGMSFAEKNYPDLIVLGAALCDGTVFEACRRLRQLRYYVPLIVYAEQADEYDRILALEVGADDTIAGRVNMREIVARIRAHLRRAYEYSKPDSDVLNIRGLVIDCARGQVFYNHRSLDLTPIEFRLLKFLVQHRDQVLSRAQILDQVWGFGPPLYGDQMVNVHICRLRRKVEADPLNPTLILTVRGLGYRLASNPERASARR